MILNCVHDLVLYYCVFLQSILYFWKLKNQTNIKKKQNKTKKTTCVGGLKVWKLIKKRFYHWCFPVNIVKIWRKPFFTEHFRMKHFCMKITQWRRLIELINWDIFLENLLWGWEILFHFSLLKFAFTKLIFFSCWFVRSRFIFKVRSL